MTLMAEDIDRSGLFNEIRQFSQRKLKKVETKETTGSGEVLTVKRNAKGLQTVKSDGVKSPGYVVDHKPDLQVGMVIPGLFIGSQDVAHDRKTLEQFEITHILNLGYGIENAFEDDYNYKKLEILDTPETDIRKYFDECFEFIDEGRQRGNVLVHCNAGVSRSCAICCAYLMTKEKKTFDEALNMVREARPFSRPNDGFTKQLKEYDEELKGSHGLKEANVDDSFTARKRAEIEAEKAALLSSNASVKNKLKQFGATLDAHFAQRAKFINSPIKLPLKKKPQNDVNANNKMPPPPPPPNCPPPPPPPPGPMNQKNKPQTEPPKPRPEPIKMRDEPKKIIINKDKNNKITDPNKSPTIDETPISVKAFRKNFEMNNKMEIPKVQRTPATPKTNAMTNNPWNKAQTQTPSPAPEERKKKIIIKQRSKEAEEVPQRRSTRDLVDALEKANSPASSGHSSPQQQLPYGQRRRQTTQLVNDSNNTNQQPLAVRQRMREFENKTTPSPQPRTITLMKQSSASPSPAASSPMSSNRNSPQPPISHSPSPLPSDNESNQSKMVFGRVRPPRLSITGRTLSQASQTLQDVSKANAITNDSATSSLTASASNSRSESPVSAVGHTRDTKTTSKSASKEPSKRAEAVPPAVQSAMQSVQSVATNKAKPVSDNVDNKWTSNATLDMNKSKNKQKSVSPDSSSDESSEEELEDNKAFKSTLSMQMKPINKNITNNEPQNDSSLTEPSNDNRFNTKRVPLGKIGGQQSLEKNKSGLNRSSSAAILKLIKSNTKTDIGLDRVEEDEEIEALLMELEKEGVDNIDWDELNVDHKKVKEIIENEKADETSDEEDDDEEESSSDEETDSDDDEAVHMVINRQAPKEESDKSDFEVVDDEEESD